MCLLFFLNHKMKQYNNKDTYAEAWNKAKAYDKTLRLIFSELILYSRNTICVKCFWINIKHQFTCKINALIVVRFQIS